MPVGRRVPAAGRMLKRPSGGGTAGVVRWFARTRQAIHLFTRSSHPAHSPPISSLSALFLGSHFHAAESRSPLLFQATSTSCSRPAVPPPPVSSQVSLLSLFDGSFTAILLCTVVHWRLPDTNARRHRRTISCSGICTSAGITDGALVPANRIIGLGIFLWDSRCLFTAFC